MKCPGTLTKVQLRGVRFPGGFPALKADAGIPWLRALTQPICRVNPDTVESRTINIVGLHVPMTVTPTVKSPRAEKRADNTPQNNQTQHPETPQRAPMRATAFLPVHTALYQQPPDDGQSHQPH